MRANRQLTLVIAVVLNLSVACGTAWGAAKDLPVLPSLQAPIGTPQKSTPKDDPLIINLQLRDPADKTKGRHQKVSVDYTKSAQKAGESDPDYAARLTREKAKTIADATNALVPGTAKMITKDVDVLVGYKGKGIPVFKKFKQGYVEFSNLVNDPALKKHDQLRGQSFTLGEYTKDKNGKTVLVGANPTGEPGGGVWGQGKGGGIPPPPPSGSPGSMNKGTGSMSGSPLGSASGLSSGDFPIEPRSQSYVAFGILNLTSDGSVDPSNMFIAYTEPFFGETTDQILSDLLGQLLSMGVQASFDPSEHALSIDNFAYNTQQIWWNETDSGIDFSMGVGFVVSEPRIAVLVISSLVLLAWVRRYRPRLLDSVSGRHNIRLGRADTRSTFDAT